MFLLRKTLTITCIIMLCFSGINVFSQSSNFTNYTTQHGLPSNTIYDMVIDNYGFLWLSSNFGIAKFDGKTFKTFTKHHGIPDNEILGFFKDSKNRIWLKSFNGGVAYIEDGKIKNKSNTPNLSKLKLEGGINGIAEDKLGNIYFSTFRNMVVKYSTVGKVDTFQYDDIKVLIFNDVHYNVFIYCQNSQDYSIVNISTNEIINIDTLSVSKSIYYELGQSNNNVLSCLNANITNTIKKRYNNYFITEHDGIFWKYSKVNPLEEHDIYSSTDSKIINNIYANKSIIDNENNLWFCSLNSGIYKLNPQIKQTISLENITAYEKATCMSKNKDITYIGSSQGYIYKVNNDGTIIPLFAIRKNKPEGWAEHKIRKILTTPDGYLFVGTDYGLFKYDKHFNNVAQRTLSFKDFTIGEKAIYVSNYNSLLKLNYDDLSHISKEISSRTSVSFLDSNENLWVGSNNGLSFKSGDGALTEIKLHDTEQVSISIICETIDGTIIIGTLGNGIFLLNQNGIVLQNITQLDGLSSNIVNHIHVNELNDIWISSNEGISKLDIADKNKISTYNKDIGFTSNLVLQSFTDDSNLYVLNPESLSCIDLDILSNQTMTSPKIYLDQVLVGKETAAPNDLKTLKYDQTNISFTFSASTINNPENLIYRYRLKGANDDWSTNKDGKVLYANLPPGKYAFEAYAKLNNQPIAEAKYEKLIIPFKINPVWYKNNLFRVVLALLLSLLIYQWTKRRFLNERKKHKSEIELTKLKQRALLTEMNPHFINNCLSSIQNYILTGEKREASNYLTKFAKLIRMILVYSRYEYIKLSDEIEHLELYLELEQLRFSHKFSYSLDVTVDDINDTQIPTMLIQPLVENAINHGFDFSNNESKKLKIEVIQQTDYILCNIIDNGVGLEKSKTRKRPHSSGIAVSNIEKRVEHLRSQYHLTSFSLTEMKSDNMVIGATASIKLPYNTII